MPLLVPPLVVGDGAVSIRADVLLEASAGKGNGPVDKSCYVQYAILDRLLHHVTNRPEHGGGLWSPQEPENKVDRARSVVHQQETHLLRRQILT